MEIMKINDKKTEVFTFNELSDRVKGKAVRKYGNGANINEFIRNCRDEGSLFYKNGTLCDFQSR